MQSNKQTNHIAVQPVDKSPNVDYSCTDDNDYEHCVSPTEHHTRAADRRKLIKDKQRPLSSGTVAQTSSHFANRILTKIF